ncbi:MAG: RpiB/LacA/LacB family sugar-phosphate isomerase [Dehalococcoidia bacterium]
MRKNPVAVAADHGGFYMKNALADWLSDKYDPLDLGAHRYDPNDDYPDLAEAVARAVASGHAERGVIICGSGVGACIAANKVPGVRACLCHDTYSAHQGVEHDDMNILCLGARVIGLELARELVAAFLSASYSGQERHRRRLDKLLAIESQALQRKNGRSSV